MRDRTPSETREASLLEEERRATREVIADLLIPQDRAFDRYVHINTRNDGVLLKYIHRFKKECRPLFA
jgi:hypothetical protein